MDLPDDQKQAIQKAIAELEKVLIVVKARAGLDGDDFNCFTLMIKLKTKKS